MSVFTPFELIMFQTHNGVFSRLDLVVRYLYLEGLYGEKDFKECLDLYEKMQLQRAGTTYHISGRPCKEEFEILSESFKASGYLDEFPLLVNEAGHLINSSHRAACSLYFEIEKLPYEIVKDWRSAIVNKKAQKKTYLEYGNAWFEENDFSKEEMNIIHTKRKELFLSVGHCFIFVLWDPAKDVYKEITKDIEKDFEILKVSDFEIKDKQKYVELGLELYKPDDIREWKLKEKFENMGSYKNIRIIYAHRWTPTFRNKTQEPNKILCKEVEKVKKHIRETYKENIPDYYFDNIVHAGDNFDHTSQMIETIKNFEKQNES